VLTLCKICVLHVGGRVECSLKGCDAVLPFYGPAFRRSVSPLSSMFPRIVLQLIVTDNVPRSLILSTLMMEAV
jgi:hypothetical protein